MYLCIHVFVFVCLFSSWSPGGQGKERFRKAILWIETAIFSGGGNVCVFYLCVPVGASVVLHVVVLMRFFSFRIVGIKFTWYLIFKAKKKNLIQLLGLVIVSPDTRCVNLPTLVLVLFLSVNNKIPPTFCVFFVFVLLFFSCRRFYDLYLVTLNRSSSRVRTRGEQQWNTKNQHKKKNSWTFAEQKQSWWPFGKKRMRWEKPRWVGYSAVQAR